MTEQDELALRIRDELAKKRVYIPFGSKKFCIDYARRLLAEAGKGEPVATVHVGSADHGPFRQLLAERTSELRTANAELAELNADANRYQALLPIILGFNWLAEGRGGHAYDETAAYESDVRGFVHSLLDCLPPHRDQPFHAVVTENFTLKRQLAALKGDAQVRNGIGGCEINVPILFCNNGQREILTPPSTPSCSPARRSRTVNEQLQAFARAQLKDGLAQCPPDWQLIFRRMYSHKDLDAPIDQVVDSMPAEKLDWAMQQVERSLVKLAKKGPNRE
jgi:hypothetical protein